jgi:hypothetical protein
MAVVVMVVVVVVVVVMVIVVSVMVPMMAMVAVMMPMMPGIDIDIKSLICIARIIPMRIIWNTPIPSVLINNLLQLPVF